MSTPEIFHIKSDIAELKRVENFLRSFFERNHLSYKYFNKVFLCISEAVTNSIEHGNKNDLKKDVTIHIKIRNNYLEIEVHDQGDGFNFKCLEDPTIKKNIKNETGRGVHIMKSLANKLTYLNSGKVLKINMIIK